MVRHNLHVLHVQIAHHVGQGRRLVVELVYCGLDAGIGRDHDLHVVAGHELYVVNCEDIGWVAHGKDERGTGPVHRYGLVLLHHVGGEELDHRRIDVEVGQIDGRDAVLLGEERGQLGLFDISVPDEHRAQPELPSGAFLLLQGLNQLFFSYQVASNEKFAQSAWLHEDLSL